MKRAAPPLPRRLLKACRTHMPRMTLALIALNLVGLACCTAEPGAGAQWRAARGGTYEHASPHELALAKRLFERELTRAGASANDWQQLGFERSAATIGATECSWVREADSARRGRGLYLFCPDPARRTALQAPHGITDLHTGEIAAALAGSGRFAVVAWNTVPRSSAPARRRNDADLAHLPASYFTALTRALVADVNIERVVQIHGFSASARRTAPAAQAGFIISNGQHASSAEVERLVSVLRRHFAVPVLAFPRDVRELGGTTNVLGKIIRSVQEKQFVHVEISRPLRERLRDDATLAALLASAVAP